DLEAEQRNQRAVLDGLTDGVFLLHDDEIRFANRAASSLFRAPTTGWRDMRIAGVGLPASVVSAIESRLGPDSEPESVECGPDPSGRHLRVTVLPLNPDDRFRRTLVVIADVTERIRIDAMRRDFVAKASHELKTPTSAIHLLAEAAATAAADGDAEQAVEFARQISAESNRLNRLVGDLLDLSRLEGAPEPGSVSDLREAIANAVIAHRIPAKQRGLELRFDDRASGIDAYVAADPTDLAVALDNLLENAIKYTETGLVTVGLSMDDESASIDVSDSGIGIPTEDLPRIFERFYRVDRARTRVSGGTGLGLALVRHVVERSNGSIQVDSTLGEGTTFTLRLPRA
ncbi:MAG: ATP-binding protein, partial [Coriobacteriia bacterium]|nr:ATP-binding protein [Coriobacteriia bacterium]